MRDDERKRALLDKTFNRDDTTSANFWKPSSDATNAKAWNASIEREVADAEQSSRFKDDHTRARRVAFLEGARVPVPTGYVSELPDDKRALLDEVFGLNAGVSLSAEGSRLLGPYAGTDPEESEGSKFQMSEFLPERIPTVPTEKPTRQKPVERFDMRGVLNPTAARSGVLLNPEGEDVPAMDNVVLPSGTVLRKSDQNMDDFFRRQVIPQIDIVQIQADKRYEKKRGEQTGKEDRSIGEMWRASLGNDPMTGFSPKKTADVVQQIGTRIQESGPARIVSDVLSGVDAVKVNTYIADHLAEDPEFAAAANRLRETMSAVEEVSDEQAEQLQDTLSPAQRRQYDKAVAEEQVQITKEQETFQKAADVAWKRQTQRFQQNITERLVEEMARRNMPKSELEAFARIAFNSSIPGMLINLTVGQSVADKALHAQIMQRAMEKYDPSLATKIGGEVAGLLLGSPVFSAGGALGKVGAAGLRKLAERRVVGKLMQRGVVNGAEHIAKRVAGRSAMQQLGEAAVMGGTTLATFDAASTPLALAAAGQDIGAKEVLGATGRGFATGMLLPGIGMVTGRAASAAGSRIGRYVAEAGGFAAENAAFVGMGTLYNGLTTGEWGSPEQLAEEFGHSVGVLGIMKSIGALKRGREKNPGFYDKVLAETEFTPEEVVALNRAGVDGRSYKRAIFDLLNAKEGVSGRDVAKQAATRIDSRYTDIMQSPDVPMSAKAKLLYMVEGRIPGRIPLTTDVRRTMGENGRVSVDLLDPAENLVQRRTFSSEKAADTFERESAGLREINTIQYYENKLGEQRYRTVLDEAAQVYAAERSMGAEAVRAELQKAAQRQPHDAEMVSAVVERGRLLLEKYDDIPAMIADGVSLKYGLGERGFERALTLKESTRTPKQREAVAEYASRLKEFVTQDTQTKAPTPEQQAERQLTEVADREIAATKNRDDDVVYTATMQDGRTANIIKGAGLVYDPQTGEIDVAQSDPTVVVRYDDGTMRQVSVHDIDMIVEAVSVDDARAQVQQTIQEQLAAAARQEPATKATATGELVELKDGRIAAIEGVNEDGTLLIALQNEAGQIVTESVTEADIAGPAQSGETDMDTSTPDTQVDRSQTVEETAQVDAEMKASTVPNTQVSEPEIPRQKNGQPDYNAMSAEMLAVELSESMGHDKAVERVQVSRKVNRRAMEKLRKSLEEMGDLNKATATEQKLAAMQSEDERLASALEQLGIAEDQSKEKAVTETFSKEIDRLFPDGLPNVQSRILADIARGQRFVWTNSSNGAKRGMATELGFTGNEGERRARFGTLGTENTGARHVSSYVHDLWEGSNGYAFDMDDAALRNEVIDVLLATPSRTAAMEQLRDMATRNAEDVALPRDAEDQAAIEAYKSEQEALRQSENNGIFAGNTPEMYGKTEKSGRDNDGRRQTNSRGISESAARVDMAASDRGDIRVFEEGMGSSYNEHPEYSERDRREAESQRLVAIAKESGLYIDPKEWSRFGQKYPKRTGESVVYIDEPNGKVYKIKDPYAKAAIRGGMPEDAIYDHVIHSILFPEARYAFEGISDHLGDARIVLSQNYIESVGQPTQPQIDAALAARGLYPEDKYHYGNDLVSVTDVEGDNALLGYDGKIYFIDPIIRLKKPARDVIDALEADGQQSNVIPEQGISSDDVPFSIVKEAVAAPEGITPERWVVIVDQLRQVIGPGNVVTDQEEVREAYNQIMRRGDEVRQHQIEQANERFNTQLELFSEGKLLSGDKIDLGTPGATLRACGIHNADMTVTQRVLKEHMDKHGLTVDDIRDLPAALDNPIMVYEWGAKAKATVVVTEIVRGDERIAVALKLKPGRNGAVVNAVASVHGKSVERLLADMNTPLTDFGSENLKWVNKEKVLDWIAAGDSFGPSGSSQGLVTATNIVTNFENPKIGPENMRRSIVSEETQNNIQEEKDAIQKQAKADGTYLKAPNGNPTNLTANQWKTVRTQAFKKWFGDWENDPASASTVVDKNGEPLVVYHGTPKRASRKFNIFNTENAPAWFSSYREYAKVYANEGQSKGLKRLFTKENIYDVFLNIKHPVYVGSIGWGSSDQNLMIRDLAKVTGLNHEDLKPIFEKHGRVLRLYEITNSKSFKDLIIQKGYDGIVALEGGITTYAVNTPEQVKSAKENIGTYDSQNPHIRYFRTPEGEVYGFTTGGKVYLDSSRMNAATPMHEYTELWSQIVAREQPELWARGAELMKQTKVWAEVNADPNYKQLSEDMRVSETLSRIVAEEFAGEQAKITDDSKLIGKLRAWLRKFWKSLKETFSKWSKTDLDKLTGTQFAKMPLRDFVEGIDLRKYNPRRGEDTQITTEKTKIRETAQAAGTYLKAPNGKPTKLTTDQWETVRTGRFKNWFGDWENDSANASKVVDENGEPKVMYHGSPLWFHEFKHRFIGLNGTAWGQGFYFSPSKDVAQGYTTHDGRMLEVYLNIRKPLSLERKTITRAQYKKFIDVLDRYVPENGDEPMDILSNYGDVEYEGRGPVLNDATQQGYEGSKSDAELVGSLINASGDAAAVESVLKKTLGYDGIIAPNGLEFIVTNSSDIKSATDNSGAFDAANPDIRFSRALTNRKVTTLEKLENKRSVLIAGRENVANFDEQLMSVDAEIEAYKLSDPVFDTYSENGAEAESDAHLRAVEDAVYDIQRELGIDNTVVVTRNQPEFINRCRELGVPETIVQYYTQENCPNGIRIGDTFLIRANDKKFRVDAEKTLLHERAHFVTHHTWMKSDAGLERLYDAAVEAGAEYMNHRLEQRNKSYHVDADDPSSMVDGINEMISRNVDILWKKGILQKYVFAEGNGFGSVDAYLSEHGVPEGLKKLILYQCEVLKYGKAKVQSGEDAGSDHSRLFPARESDATADVSGRGVNVAGREIAGYGVEAGRDGVAGDGDGHLGRGRGGDINPSFSENSDDFTDTAPKLTKHQQLIADLRRAVRESKASVRAVAQIVSRRVREEVGRDMAEVMGKREFDALIRQVEQATLRNEVERPLRRIAEIVCDLEIKRTQASIDKSLKQKVQGEGTRGVAAAKVVDDRTRQAFELFRNNIGRPAEVVESETAEDDALDRLARIDALNILEVYNDALRYRRDIADIDSEKKGVYSQSTEKRKQRIEANKAGDAERFEALKSEIILNNDIIEALDQEQIQIKEHLLSALRAVDRSLNGLIGEGREIYAEWMEKRDNRKKEIVAMAFRDAGDGKSIPVLDRQPGVWEQGYRRTVDFLLSPAYSMNYLLKMISVNAPKGEGVLYDHFMRGEHGYVEARGRYYLGYEGFKKQLDEKAQIVFGKSYTEVLADSNAPTVATISIKNGLMQEQYSPTIGEALYIYMADEMEDGQVKIRKMGISKQQVDALAGTLPPQFVHFADWLQNEFLPERRKVYNETHLDVFGIQMAQIEHYVPLRIQKSNVRQEVNGAEPEPDTLPSSITGSIIKRIRNKQVINLHTNALDLMLEHGRQMEHWNAFTRVVQDMNALLSSTAFRRMLDTRNPGLHKRLKIAAQLAADSYRPQTNDVNRAWIALGKLAASSKIAFRVNTAAKQVVSFPSFYPYSSDPKFWLSLTKNLSPTTWGRNWRWALDNIPSFRERWLGRMAGNEKLAQMTAPALDKWLDKMNRYGMVPNAFVDALTCANGAKAVYDYRKGFYLERGRTDVEAERLARIDAAIAINETQQSSEGMYLGQMQADRDFWSVSLSTFRNSDFSYLRKLLEGIDELFRDAERERLNRKRYYEEKGMLEDEASEQAIKDVVAAKREAALIISVFGFILGVLWRLCGSVWKYLFAPESRDEIPAELAKSAFVAPIRNTTVGSIAESMIDGYGANPSVLLSDMVGFYNKMSRIAQKDNPDAWNETAAYIAVQTLTANGLGIDLESFLNMYQGVAGMIRDGADVEDIMRIMNAPQAQAKLIAGKPKEGETPEQYAERMIFTERRIAERVDKKRRDKWSRNYAAYRQAEALGMKPARDKSGNVTIPEMKRVDADYQAALKQAGVTVSGNMRKDHEWQDLTPEQQERWRHRAQLAWKIYNEEKQLDTVVIFNERYAERMRGLMQMKQEYTKEVDNNKN